MTAARIAGVKSVVSGKGGAVCVSVINAYQASPPDTWPLLTALSELGLTQAAVEPMHQSPYLPCHGSTNRQ